MKLFQLTISRVDMPLFSDEVVSVTVPGAAGDMTLLANHSAIISPLRSGTIVIKKEDEEEETFTIESGTLEMSNNQATILV